MKNPSKELVASLVAILVIFGYVQGVVVPNVANQSAAVSRSYNALAPGQGPCIPSTTVKCGMVRIIKNTLPDNYQDFNFTTNITGYPATFTLDDDATLLNPSTLSNVQYFNVFNGNYNVAETPAVPGYAVTVSCTDPSGGTLTGGTSASISVSNHENITCTFRNVGTPQTHICVPTPTIPCGSITIVKDTVSDDYQDFAFSNTIPGYPASFTLDDDATLTNPSVTSNTLTFTTAMTGSYTIAETTSLTGYAVTIACTDPSGGTTTSGVTANISISNGENVVCTFTNTNNTIAACTPDTWTQKTDFPGGTRSTPVGFSIAGLGYVGMGIDQSNQYNEDLWQYNPLTNAWVQKANYAGGPRVGPFYFSINTKGYVGMGRDQNNMFQSDFWEYDPTSNIWIQKTGLPGVLRNNATSFSVGGKGYVGTGRNSLGLGLYDFWEYDPLGNAWTQKADFGFPNQSLRWNAIGFSVGNKGFIGTGQNALGLGNSLESLWSYDPITDTWAPITNYASGPKTGVAGFSIGNNGYVGTGYNSDTGLAYQDFWKYDPVTNVWTQKADFGGGPRRQAVGISINGRGYVGLGSLATSTLFQDWWEYCP